VNKHAFGTGPGAVSDDGCPVEVYRRLRAYHEPDLIRSVLPPGSTVLDLGAGAGRIAHPLIASGHRVTAVDHSLEMLSLIRGAEVVHDRIQDLELGHREFDCVLLASYLLNASTRTARADLLRTCRRYTARGGVLLAQVRSSTMLSDCTGRTREEDGVRDTIETYQWS
jgi:ubiquinone/menaquinone biosynthesis C-methylase UbiE